MHSQTLRTEEFCLFAPSGRRYLRWEVRRDDANGGIGHGGDAGESDAPRRVQRARRPHRQAGAGEVPRRQPQRVQERHLRLVAHGRQDV